jgi:hypothetical protein
MANFKNNSIGAVLPYCYPTKKLFDRNNKIFVFLLNFSKFQFY